MTDYTPITWPEVRKCDVLMHPNGDRMKYAIGFLTASADDIERKADR